MGATIAPMTSNWRKVPRENSHPIFATTKRIQRFLDEIDSIDRLKCVLQRTRSLEGALRMHGVSILTPWAFQDEATSGLDFETEKLVMSLLGPNCPKRHPLSLRSGSLGGLVSCATFRLAPGCMDVRRTTSLTSARGITSPSVVLRGRTKFLMWPE
jgi:hypothetical protein